MGSIQDSRKLFLQPTVDSISVVLGLPSLIWLFDNDENALKINAASQPFDEDYKKQAFLRLDEPCGASEVFHSHETLFVPNIEEAENWKYKEEMLEMGIRAATVVPLWIKQKPVGILDVYIPQISEFNFRENKPTIETFAHQISATLRQIQGLEILNKVGQLINLDLQHSEILFEHIMQSAQRVLDCHHVSIFLVKTNGALVLEKSSSSRVKRRCFKLGEGLAGTVLQTGRSLLVNDVRQSPRFVQGLSSDIQERSMLLTPIALEGQIVGVISADSERLNGFDQYDQNLLETLSQQTAITIHNLQLFQEKQEQKQRAETLQKVAQIVNSTLDLDKLGDLVLEQLYTILEYKSASFQTIHGNERRLLAHRGFSPADHPEKFLRKTSEDPLITKVIQGKEVIVISNTEEEELWDVFPETAYIKSWIGVPIIAQEQVIGLLTIDHPKTGYYTKKSGEIATAFADQIATALLNSEKVNTFIELNHLFRSLLSLEESSKTSELLQEIAERAKEILKADLIEVYEFQQGKDNFVLPQIVVGEKFEPEVSKDKIYDDDILFRFINRPNPLYYEDAQKISDLLGQYSIPREDIPSKRFVVREKILSNAIIPLRAGTEPVGLMFANYRTHQTFSSERKELIEMFANQAAVVIRKTRLIQRQEVLIQLAEKLTIQLTEEAILLTIYEYASQLMLTDNVYIALYDDNSEKLYFKLVYENGIKQDVDTEKWQPRQIDKNKMGRMDSIFINKEYLLLKTALEAQEWYEQPGHFRHEKSGIEPSWLGVPMKVGDSTLGAIAIHHKTKEGVYNDDDMKILSSIANQAAIALDNAHLYKEIKESQQTLTDIIQFLPDATFVIDSEGNVIFWNRAIQDLTGIQPDEIVGKGDYAYSIPFYGKARPILIDFILKPDDEELHRKYPTIRKTEEGKLIADNYLPHLKEGMYVLGIAAPLYDNQKNVVGAIETIVDITARKEVENKYATLVDLGKNLTSSIQLTEREIFQLIHDNAKDLMDVDNMYIALYDDFTRFVRFGIVYENGEEIDVETNPKYQPRRDGAGKTEEIIQTGRPIFHRTPQEEQEYYEKQGRQDYVKLPLEKRPFSWIGVPMKKGERILGVIATYPTKKDYVYGDDAVEILQAMANLAAIALDNIRLYNDTYQRQEVLLELAQSQFEESKILNAIHEKAYKLLDAENMYIALYDEKMDSVSFPLIFREGQQITVLPREHVQTREKIGRTEAIIRNKKPIFHPTKAENLAWYQEPGHEDFVSGEMWLSWIGVPMLKGENVLGVIAAYHTTKENAYSQTDLNILRTMANLTAIALENARLYAEQKQQKKELEKTNQALHEAHRRIAEAQDSITRTRIATDFMHRLSNLAGTVPIWADLIQERTEELVNKIKGDISNLLEAAENWRTQDSEQNVNVRLVLETIIDQVQVQYRQEIQEQRLFITTEIDSELPEVWGIYSGIANAIFNVITNGIESILTQKSGTLAVKAQHIKDEEENEYASIEIHDTGQGIPQSYLPKLFTLSFSTKGVERGYGLWSARMDIEHAGGKIELIFSKEGVGAAFLILLPKSSKEV